MRKFTLSYPDSLLSRLNMSSEELEGEMRFIIAAKLYDMGKINCGKAAEMAGLDRIEWCTYYNREKCKHLPSCLQGNVFRSNNDSE